MVFGELFPFFADPGQRNLLNVLVGSSDPLSVIVKIVMNKGFDSLLFAFPLRCHCGSRSSETVRAM
jgi:hypothetical protein